MGVIQLTGIQVITNDRSDRDEEIQDRLRCAYPITVVAAQRLYLVLQR